MKGKVCPTCGTSFDTQDYECPSCPICGRAEYWDGAKMFTWDGFGTVHFYRKGKETACYPLDPAESPMRAKREVVAMIKRMNLHSDKALMIWVGKGTMRRFSYFPFTSTWVEHPA